MKTQFRARSPANLLSLALVFLTLAVLACRFSPGATETDEPQGFLPLTAVASITPPPPPRQSCPVDGEQPAQPEWDEPQAAARPLLDYLNAGGSPQQASAPDGQRLQLNRPDLDGDGLVDLAIVVSEETQSISQSGTLLVFSCQQNQYELIYTSAPNIELSAPEVVSSEDLNQDGRQDLLIMRRRCGAHTCSAEVQYLVKEDDGLLDRLEGETDDLPSPQIQIHDQGENPATIEITAGGINSVGAGPFRPISRIWSWDEQTKHYQPTEERQAQTGFRIHKLHDADLAAQQGNIAEARSAYDRVIEDDTLGDWVQPEQERAVLAAYAQFRLVTLAIQSGNGAEAESRLSAMQAAVDPESIAGPYLDMANSFYQTFQQTSNYQQACQTAQAFAAAHRTEILDPLYFGYSNPTYTPEDLCPIETG